MNTTPTPQGDARAAIMLPTAALRANDYNPNRMTKAEFSELVAEVAHLGRLPKPVVARRDGDDYVIVDGEHGWRAAQEVGLSEVSCEVIAADDFEAMRQTYKRNQHGSHDPVLLGRVFRRMLEARGLSQRALASEIAVSEGTIRNALLYADAADLRNSYAPRAARHARLTPDGELMTAEGEVARLSVRQVRQYIELPAALRDLWLDAGADLKAAVAARSVRLLIGGKETRLVLDDDSLEHIAELGLLATVETTPQGFVPSVHRAARLWHWRQTYVGSIEDVDAYLRPVAELGLDDGALDRLPLKAEPDRLRVLLSPEDWAAILGDCAREALDERELAARLGASVRLALRRAGVALEDISDPRVAAVLEIVSMAPDFIRDSGLSLRDRALLAAATADVPTEVLLEAKRWAVEQLRARDRFLTAGAASPVPDDMAEAQVERSREDWARWTVPVALNEGLKRALTDRRRRQPEGPSADHERLIRAVVGRLAQSDVIRETTIGGRPTRQVLEERLRLLPRPEYLLLATVVIGDGMDPGAAWKQALENEIGLERTDIEPT